MDKATNRGADPAPRYDYDLEISPMSKGELAALYAPGLTPHAAVNRLMNWIARHPTLPGDLAATGYRKRARMLSARQVHLIVDRLGEP